MIIFAEKYRILLHRTFQLSLRHAPPMPQLQPCLNAQAPPPNLRPCEFQSAYSGKRSALCTAPGLALMVAWTSSPTGLGVGQDTALFRRLVLGWISADFRVQIRIFQHFSRSTSKSTSRNQSEFLQNIANICKDVTTCYHYKYDIRMR